MKPPPPQTPSAPNVLPDSNVKHIVQRPRQPRPKVKAGSVILSEP
jgi:hypothetical protein